MERPDLEVVVYKPLLIVFNNDTVADNKGFNALLSAYSHLINPQLSRWLTKSPKYPEAVYILVFLNVPAATRHKRDFERKLRDLFGSAVTLG